MKRLSTMRAWGGRPFGIRESQRTVGSDRELAWCREPQALGLYAGID